MQIQFCRDERKAHMGKAPVLGVVAKAYGRNIAEGWLEVQLVELSEYAGCKGKLTTHQLLSCAQMILETYGHYKLTEFMLFFQRFKRARYGKFYGSVDPMVIMEALKDFNDERFKDTAQYRREEEKEQEAERKRQYDERQAAITERYRAMVPNAFTDDAPIDRCSFEVLKLHKLDDDALKARLQGIADGTDPIPQDISQCLQLMRAMKQA